ncbi:Anoctamin-7, partial [Chytridiales sp. JEL 0842]
MMHLFKGGDLTEYRPREIQSSFFRDSHRSLLTYHILQSVEVKIDTVLGKHRREGIGYLIHEGVYTAMFHVHDDEFIVLGKPLSDRYHLKKDWVQKYFATQPLDEVAAYFGEKVALYFAFIGFYNLWLIIASVAGILVCLRGVYEASREPVFSAFKIFDNDFSPWFGLIMSLWAILMPTIWKRQNIFYAWRWSTYDFEKEETRRPQFKATTT